MKGITNLSKLMEIFLGEALSGSPLIWEYKQLSGAGLVV